MVSTKKPVAKSTGWEVQFVQCELDKSTKETVKKWDVKYEATLDGFERLITEGYKVSISRDKYHDCVGVFMTMPDGSHPSHGYCLSARAPGILDAIKVLVYKHFQILDGDWGTINNQPQSRDSWG